MKHGLLTLELPLRQGCLQSFGEFSSRSDSCFVLRDEAPALKYHHSPKKCLNIVARLIPNSPTDSEI